MNALETSLLPFVLMGLGTGDFTDHSLIVKIGYAIIRATNLNWQVNYGEEVE